MQHSDQHPLGDDGADAILSYLTTRQFLNPHANTGEILAQTTDAFGCCPLAIDRALVWLKVEPTQSIGRLRRTELVQLARAVHRFWMQNQAAVSAAD